MAWLESLRAAQVASIGALLLVGVACGGEDKKTTGSGDDDDDKGEEAAPEGETDEDAGTDTDPSKPAFPDASKPPPPPPPPVSQDGAVALPDGELPNPTDEDAAVPPGPPPALPFDGAKRSICYADSDCVVNDLKCFRPPTSTGPGVCVDDCESDKECPELDGVAGACSPLLSPNACEYSCAGENNDGMGSCPKDMVCNNFGTPNLLPIWRCQYPNDSGKKTEPLWGRCDRSHNGGDCEGANTCFRPAASAGTITLPHGYCSNECMADTDCVAPAGKTAVPACMAGFNRCVLRCDGPGATCPDGMNCRGIDPLQTTATMICIYID